MNREAWFRAAWIGLLGIGVVTAAFGLITLVAPSGDDEPLLRADGLASLGVGLFGALITFFAFRTRQPWAWWALWFYPVFWLIHLFGRLPPGKDHIHQIVFAAISLAALVVSVREFFPAGR